MRCFRCCSLAIGLLGRKTAVVGVKVGGWGREIEHVHPQVRCSDWNWILHAQLLRSLFYLNASVDANQGNETKARCSDCQINTFTDEAGNDVITLSQSTCVWGGIRRGRWAAEDKQSVKSLNHTHYWGYQRGQDLNLPWRALAASQNSPHTSPLKYISNNSGAINCVVIMSDIFKC